MKPYISPAMQGFLTPRKNGNTDIEEAIDQPLYHIQAIATTSATQYTFFNTAAGGYAVTNMDAQSVLSKGKRFALFGIGLAFIGGQNPEQHTTNTTLNSYLNDAKTVLESAGWLELNILDKNYLRESPLFRVPAGVGVSSGGAAVQQNLASAADRLDQISYGSNGMPMLSNLRKLRVPIPIPEQTKFAVVVNFSAALTLVTAGSLAAYLDGVTVRAIQ